MIDIEKLNSEIDKEWQKCNPVDEGMGVETANVHIEQFDHIARHFIQWGAEHAKDDLEKPVPNDLEEAANEYEKENTGIYPEVGQTSIRDAFIDGVEWGREQMMNDGNVILAEEDFDAEKEKSMERGYNLCKKQMFKDVVEGEIVKDNRGNNVVRAGAFNKDFEYGDKVRIIIVKEDNNEMSKVNLDEAAKKCVASIIYEQGLYDGDFLIPVCEDIFKAGAEWQEERTKETIELAEEHAYLAGSVNEREKMMKNAVEGRVILRDMYDNRSLDIDFVLPDNLKIGEKVKVIVAKDYEGIAKNRKNH